MQTYDGKVLTLKQPWASALAYGGKNVENRTWKTGHRGRLAIHAGYNVDEAGPTEVAGMSVLDRVREGCGRLGISEDAMFPAGYVIAVVRLVDCREESPSPWYFPGQFAWIIEDVTPIVPVPMRGHLGLWEARFDSCPLLPGNNLS